ncbi:methanol dehydrogenase [Derxia lacustris]|uniref:methanol dehydrogenase n=1 Tax=Derxia lacustris TaxID=764842 RepID=UPI000A1702E8|nr:methanol dehydrogenase [Derxia lacustris]
MNRNTPRRIATLIAGAVLAAAAQQAAAYDGTKCKAPGDCWEPKPGFPDKIAATKYDPKHDPKEVARQSNSIKEMEARNARRVEQAAKTGVFKYDVD